MGFMDFYSEATMNWRFVNLAHAIETVVERRRFDSKAVPKNSYVFKAIKRNGEYIVFWGVVNGSDVNVLEPEDIWVGRNEKGADELYDDWEYGSEDH
ncbi:hypothetical protein VPHD479_0390 [Vibrio phage D479]